MANTLKVAVGLSLVCSILVATAAVLLKPQQLRNEEDYRQRIILDVAGLMQPGLEPSVLFESIEPRMVELATGRYVAHPDPQSFDAQAAAGDPQLGTPIPPELDIAQLKRRALYAPVYLVRDGGHVTQLILPVYGSGLWSTMYGYLALDTDANTVRGLRFYSHAETPGLGDQIDRTSWLAQWPGLSLFDDDGRLQVEVVKGVASDGSRHRVDGLAGATLTGRGVTNLIRYWVGEHGFGPYLDRIREEGGQGT